MTSFSNLEMCWDENREKNYTKIKMYILFLQNYLMIFKEATRSLDEDEQAAPELFRGVRVRGGHYDKTSHSQRNASIFWKWDCMRTPKKPTKLHQEGHHIKQDFLNFFIKNVTSLESNLDLTNSDYLCALKPFSLSRSLIVNTIQCAFGRFKNDGFLITLLVQMQRTWLVGGWSTKTSL